MVDASLPISHRDIIDRAGGPAATSKAISPYEIDQGRSAVDANTTKAWKRLDSIPAPYFQAFAAVELATLEELSDHAANRRARVAA
jgi:hypothetical protein